jgi:hypothetical protein
MLFDNKIAGLTVITFFIKFAHSNQQKIFFAKYFIIIEIIDFSFDKLLFIITVRK